jgi:DNA-binding transcriptional LysR family regulator
MHPKHLDIHLLRCLQALVLEQHVTRAAERMGVSQPTMSATLGRLRTLYKDPLLVRTDKGMVLTPRAAEIAASVAKALDLIDGTLNDAGSFAPATTALQVEVAASESVALVLMPALVARLRREAPGVRLRVHVTDIGTVRQELEDGGTDLVISFLRPAPQGLRSTQLLRQKLYVIAAATHPDIRGSITLEQYLGWPHARYILTHTGSSTIENEIDAALAAVGVRRDIGVQLPSALSSPPVVAGSDLLATVPERVARHFAPSLQLQVLEPPLPIPDVEISMYWHERKHHNVAHRWLRQTILELAKDLKAPLT